MDQTFGKRLRESMDLRGTNASELASRTGIGESTIFRYLSGEREPIYRNLVAIAKALGVGLDFLAGTGVGDSNRTLAELVERLAADVRSRLGISTARDAATDTGGLTTLGRIPVIGKISDGPKLQFSGDGYPVGLPVSAIPTLGDYDPHAYAIIFEGDSMTSRVLDGDVVVCSPGAEWKSGDLVVLRKTDGEMTIKEISDRQSHFVLRSYNPSYDLEEIPKAQVSFVHKLTSIRLGDEPGEAPTHYES